MELKLARTQLTAKPKKIKLDKIVEEVKEAEQKIYYFDKENSHKSMMEFVDYFENEGASVYFREVRYGLNEDDYMYEVHIL